MVNDEESSLYAMINASTCLQMPPNLLNAGQVHDESVKSERSSSICVLTS